MRGGGEQQKDRYSRLSIVATMYISGQKWIQIGIKVPV